MTQVPPADASRKHAACDRQPTVLRSVGYERFPTPEGLRQALADAGVERVIDVRDLPQSRRPGFSRRALEDLLADAGIVYEHRRELGNPRPIRETASRLAAVDAESRGSRPQ